MKKTLLILIAGVLLIAGNIYAEDGNLIVEGDTAIDGNVGIGTRTPGYKLTTVGSNENGITLVDDSGSLRAAFDLNTRSQGRFRLWDEHNNLIVSSHANTNGDGKLHLYSQGENLINLVAGGAASFKKTTVRFQDIYLNQMLTINPDNDEVVINEDSTDTIDFRAEGSTDPYLLFINAENDRVGIGTASPQSKLAVSGLPNTPPDSSGTRGIVCITNDGNMWIDDDGDTNICG